MGCRVGLWGVCNVFTLLLVLLCPEGIKISYAERSFRIDFENNQFLKDGKPFRYISGGIHYFRVHSALWEDRIKKIRAAGLNTLQTYVAWNIHEPTPGKYDFDGDRNLPHFISLAQQHDLLVIVRVGPYICAEWDFGGLPAWLLKNQSVILRSSKDPSYVGAVDRWLSVLLPKLKPLLYANGGPIISLQVENEYGSYSTCDHDYIKHLEETFRKYLGNDAILFTTDGYSNTMLECGSISSLYRTVDFGPGTDLSYAFGQQRKYQPHGPLVNSEYYTGWLDHWGTPHSRTSGQSVADWLDKILAMNASVNMYMFEGGTNFGFMNGANKAVLYLPQPTSYDYDAPLTEAGDPTDKFKLIRSVVQKYTDLPPLPVPEPSPKAAYGEVKITKMMPLLEMLPLLFKKGAPFKSRYPLAMEQVNQNYGFTLYRTTLPRDNLISSTVAIHDIRDRAVVIVDKVPKGVINRNTSPSLSVGSGHQLDILVENQGRINYGSFNDPKGIVGNVTYNGEILENWEIYPLDENSFIKAIALLETVNLSTSLEVQSPAPCFGIGTFKVAALADTFLQMNNWSKGQAFINNFNLGRYWPTVGPQKTLYVPSTVINASGENSIMLFELDKSPCSESGDCVVEFVATPDIGE